MVLNKSSVGLIYALGLGLLIAALCQGTSQKVERTAEDSIVLALPLGNSGRLSCSLSSHGHLSCPSAGFPDSRSVTPPHLCGGPEKLSVRGDGLARRQSLSEHQESAVLAKVSDQVLAGLSQWCVV